MYFEYLKPVSVIWRKKAQIAIIKTAIIGHFEQYTVQVSAEVSDITSEVLLLSPSLATPIIAHR